MKKSDLVLLENLVLLEKEYYKRRNHSHHMKELAMALLAMITLGGLALSWLVVFICWGGF